MLSVLPFTQFLPLTLKQMEAFSQSHISYDKLGLPRILVSDGKLITPNLEQSGFSLSWLQKQLKEKDCPDLEQVFLFVVNDDGSFYLAKKEGGTAV